MSDVTYDFFQDKVRHGKSVLDVVHMLENGDQFIDDEVFSADKFWDVNKDSVGYYL